MRRLATFRGVAAAVAMAIAGSALAARAADKVPSERRLPTETVGYFSVRDVQEFKQQWPQTLLGQMLAQKEMADFRDEFKAPLKQLSEKVQEQIGVTLEDLLELPQGEVALAVLPPKGATLPAALLLDFGNNRETVEKLLDKASQELVKNNAKRSEQDFEETSLVIFELPEIKAEAEAADEEAPPPAPPRTVAWFVKDTYLVMGTTVDVLKAIVTRWDGNHERTLAESPIYRYVQDRTRPTDEGRHPAVAFFADPISLLRGVLSTAGESNPQAAFAMGFIPTLGLDNFKGLGGTIEFVSNDFDSVSRLLVYLEPPKTGLLKLLTFPTSAAAPPKWISAHTSSYMRLNWDVEQAWSTIQNLYDTFAGEEAFERMIAQLAEGGPRIDLRKDIIDQLSGTFRLASEVANPEKLGTERYLAAIELKDEAAFAKTLAAIAKTEGFPGKPREFQGTTIYEFAGAPEEEKEEGAEPIPTPGIAVTHKNLMIASDVALIERVLRDDAAQESLADSQEYQRVARHYPEKTSSVSFQRSDVQLRALYEMLRSGQAEQLLGDTKIDFSKLPPFEAIRPYLTPSGSYMIPDEKGLFFSSFSLREAQK